MPVEIDNELSSVIDLTAMILVSLKNDPTPPSSPIPSAPSTPTTMRSGSPCLSNPLKTEQCDCMLCTRTAPIILSKCHTWAWIMRVVFYSLRDRYPDKKFFSLKNDVYEYMMNHWNILGLDRKPSANWHKQIQDMLSHSRNIFESGMTHFKQNGFWRLKDLEDPWTARPDTPRPPSTTPPLTPTLPLSPRKRGWKNTQSDEEQEREEEVVQTTLKKLCTPPTSPRLTLTHSNNNVNSINNNNHRNSNNSNSNNNNHNNHNNHNDSIPSSPETSSPLRTSEEIEKDVAMLREQLQSFAQLSNPSDSSSFSSSESSSPSCSIPSSPPQQQYTVFSHNRVWEDAYPFQQQIGSVQA